MAVNFRYRSADGFTIIAGPTEDLGQLIASQSAVVLGAPRKICVENISDRAVGGSPFAGVVLRRQAVGSNDGVGFLRTAADPNGTLSKPWGLDEAGGVLTGAPTSTNVGGASGVWAAAQEYGVVATALNATGETIASVEKRFTVSSLTDSWEHEVVPTPGATLYRFYRTDAPGTYGAYTLIYEGAYPSFVDDGSAPNAGAPPEENTTGGAGPGYGAAPLDGAFGTADLAIAAAPAGLAVGQQWFFYYRSRLTAGASSFGNKRQGQLLPVEA